jgi:hypothetical protein
MVIPPGLARVWHPEMVSIADDVHGFAEHPEESVFQTLDQTGKARDGPKGQTVILIGVLLPPETNTSLGGSIKHRHAKVWAARPCEPCRLVHTKSTLSGFTQRLFNTERPGRLHDGIPALMAASAAMTSRIASASQRPITSRWDWV